MPLADRTPPTRRHRGPACDTGLLVQELDGDDREAFRRMIDDPRWSVAEIHRVLRDEDVPRVPCRNSLERHRNRECTCDERGLR